MCLIIFAYRVVPDCPLVLAANRDEWFSRPAAPAGFWMDHPQVIAGRDLQAGGTWLGLTTSGRFAALTNFRNPSDRRTDAPSRGELVSGFLAGSEPAAAFIEKLEKNAAAYNGFSILVGDADELYCYSNRGNGPIRVAPGVHGLSNHLLDTPWPKVVKGCAGMEALLHRPYSPQDYLDLMDDSVPPEESGPVGAASGQDWERSLSSMRIMKGDYGTRCSTTLQLSTSGYSRLAERTYSRDGHVCGEVLHTFRLAGTSSMPICGMPASSNCPPVPANPNR